MAQENRQGAGSLSGWSEEYLARYDMGMNEYQRFSRRTVPPDMTDRDLLEMGVMGACGEAGEMIEVLKKHRFQEREFDRARLLNELGDLMWYIPRVCDALGVTMTEVARANLAKLAERYPDGWNAEDGKAKRDRQSRKASVNFL